MSFALLLFAGLLGYYANYQAQNRTSLTWDSSGKRVTAVTHPVLFRVQMYATIAGCVVALLVALAIMVGR